MLLQKQIYYYALGFVVIVIAISTLNREDQF